ncbi:MAG: formate dehydrogenase subunit delta [Novosphingobium sp.]
MTDTAAKLVRMANQIAANFAAQGEAEAIRATADHIRLFWDPRMKAGILAGGRSELSPVACAAIDQLSAEVRAG